MAGFLRETDAKQRRLQRFAGNREFDEAAYAKPRENYYALSLVFDKGF